MRKASSVGPHSFRSRPARCSRVLALVLGVLVPGSLCAGDSSELWAKGKLVAKITEHVRVSVAGTSKFDDHADYIYESKDLGFVFVSLAHWLDVGAYYKSVFHKIEIPEQEDVWQHEKRPHLNATARFRLLGLSCSNRVQVEYNSLEDLGAYQTFRNQFAINPPVYLDPLRERRVVLAHKFRPFASYEIFLTSTDDVSKHRLKGGASLEFTKNVFIDLYYMRQENSTLNTATNIGGLNLKLLL